MSALPIEVHATAKQFLGMPPARFLRAYWQKRPLLFRNAGYDGVDDFTCIATFSTGTSLVCVTPSLPVRDIPELIALSDRVAIMRNGRLVRILGGDEVDETAILAHSIGAI